MLSQAQKKLIAKLHSPRGRKKTNLFLCEGERSCLEAVQRVPEIIEFAILLEDSNIELGEVSFPVLRLDPKSFKELAATSTPQGILLVAKEPTVTPLNTELIDDYVLVLDQITDPGNFGTIVRTAWAAGLKEVWYTKGTTDPYGTKSVRSGMGAHFCIKFRKFEDLVEVEETISKFGGKLCLCKPLAETSCFSDDFTFKNNAIVLGNEANGIQFSSEASQDITIPMPGNSESLNVATAATIVMFEAVRRSQ
ncbi:MAG: RNA methyltransferase [Lentisphaeria bacterium]|nr:RNA methyltransferase [Lentisphaeria bacterium]